MAGSAVVLRTTPTTREPNEPMRTERRGPRREVELRPLGSPESFCPCVVLVTDQLSKTKSKVLPTTAQHPLKSGEFLRYDRQIAVRGEPASKFSTIVPGSHETRNTTACSRRRRSPCVDRANMAPASMCTASAPVPVERCGDDVVGRAHREHAARSAAVAAPERYGRIRPCYQV
jgi:hypothetical protein